MQQVKPPSIKTWWMALHGGFPHCPQNQELGFLISLCHHAVKNSLEVIVDALLFFLVLLPNLFLAFSSSNVKAHAKANSVSFHPVSIHHHAFVRAVSWQQSGDMICFMIQELIFNILR